MRVVMIEGILIKFRITSEGIKIISPPDPTGELKVKVNALFQ